MDQVTTTVSSLAEAPSLSTKEEPPDSKVVLQVGERRFTTTREILNESPFFQALLSERWNDAQADGSYFVDADPDLFAHILRYLRRGMYPIFYDRVKGHDYALYAALLAEAEYFGIADLQDWLKKQRYLEVVRVEMALHELTDPARRNMIWDREIEFFPDWIHEKVNPQPGMPVYAHGGYIQRKLTGVILEKKVVFDMKKCSRYRFSNGRVGR
ncbi:BTB/POZ protein [Aspergillus ambiguus]|uniref:BTB/POZ domain-containing protein n=1 Tax=Aspergillus ambiguus TaxID=176160 RepID=UPI003CCC9C24